MTLLLCDVFALWKFLFHFIPLCGCVASLCSLINHFPTLGVLDMHDNGCHRATGFQQLIPRFIMLLMLHRCVMMHILTFPKVSSIITMVSIVFLSPSPPPMFPWKSWVCGLDKHNFVVDFFYHFLTLRCGTKLWKL